MNIIETPSKHIIDYNLTDAERHRKEQEAIEEAARSTAESITHHETSFDAPRAPEATKRFVFHLSIVGDEFHCETFLGSLVTKDKAELMLLIEGAIGEVMTCAE